MWNNFKTFVLMLALMALCLAVGQVLGGRSGMVMGFAFAAIMNIGSYWFSDKLILRTQGAREVSMKEEPALFRTVQRLALAGKMPMPKVYIMEAAAPNAFATGRDLNHAAVAVTRGILGILTPPELEAVLAHELSHIKHRDMLVGTIVAVMAGGIMMIASMMRWAMIFGGAGGRDDDREGGNPLAFILVMVLAPVAAMIIQMAISRAREFGADSGGAALTGNPLALASALKKISAVAEGIPLETATPAMAHMYIVNPFGREGFVANLFSTHPSMGRRVKKLEEFASGRAKPSF